MRSWLWNDTSTEVQEKGVLQYLNSLAEESTITNWQVLEGLVAREDGVEGDEDLAGDDDEGLAVGTALLAVVGVGLAEALCGAGELLGDEVEDAPQVAVAALGEAACAAVASRLVDGWVQSGVGHQALGFGEAGQGAQFSQEGGGGDVAHALDGAQGVEGLLLPALHELEQLSFQALALVQEEEEAPDLALQQGLAGWVGDAEGVLGKLAQPLGGDGGCSAVALGLQDGGQGLLRGLSNGLGAGAGLQEPEDGLGEEVDVFGKLGEEHVHVLADAVLEGSYLLAEGLILAGEEGDLLHLADRLGEGGGLLEEAGDGVGVRGIGLEGAQGLGLAEVADEVGVEDVDWVGQGEQVGEDQGGVGAGGLKADEDLLTGGPEELELLAEGLPALLADWEGECGLAFLALVAGQEGGGEVVQGEVNADIAFHRLPSGHGGEGWKGPSCACRHSPASCITWAASPTN